VLANSPQEPKSQIRDVEVLDIVVRSDNEGVGAVEDWKNLRADFLAGE
jgi:hypothetical protein